MEPIQWIKLHLNPCASPRRDRFGDADFRTQPALSLRQQSGDPSQWDRFLPHMGTARVAYGVVCNSDDAGNFEYLCGIRCKNFRRTPPRLRASNPAANVRSVRTPRPHLLNRRHFEADLGRSATGLGPQSRRRSAARASTARSSTVTPASAGSKSGSPSAPERSAPSRSPMAAPARRPRSKSPRDSPDPT